MKRSIISFCIFAVLVVASAGFELKYSNDFAKDTLEIAQKVQNGESADIYEKYLKSGNLINRLFFKRSTIEKLEKEFCELAVYEKESNDYRACIERIKLYCRKLKNAGTY